MASSLGPAPRGASWVQRVYGRLNRRLFAWFLLFSLLPVLGTNAVGYRRSATIITDLVERFLVAYATLEAQHVGDRLQDRLKALRALVTDNEVLVTAVSGASAAPSRRGPATDSGGVQRYLQRARQELRAFDALGLFSAEGELVASTDSTQVWGAPPTVRVRAAFAEFVQSPDDGAGPSQLRFVMPFFVHDTVPAGYLVAAVRRASTPTFLQLPEYEAGSIEGVIIDAEGRPLVASAPQTILDPSNPMFLPSGALASGSVARYFDGRGRRRIAAVADIPQSTWQFVAEVSEEDALRPLRRLGGLSLLLELLLAAVLVGTAVLVAREIVTPVTRLADAARRVAAGDLSVRLPVRGYDEVAELGHAFNEMTRGLAEATTHVAELHQREIERASQLATVGELASGLAHEIKNPVIGVTNGLDLVRRRVGDDPTLTPIFDEMTRQLARIESTVHDLLAFARPATPHLGAVRANEAVARAILLIQPAAELAGVRIEVRPDAGAPSLQADASMVHQALVNLLMNAVQATSSGGRIQVLVHGEENAVVIEIVDTGRGIAASELQHVFRPFFTTRHKGTGLGLSITRGIIERHHGTLALHSAEGVGTTVTLRLPRRPDEQTMHEEAGP